jgi:hypothetical protein
MRSLRKLKKAAPEGPPISITCVRWESGGAFAPDIAQSDQAEAEHQNAGRCRHSGRNSKETGNRVEAVRIALTTAPRLRAIMNPGSCGRRQNACSRPQDATSAQLRVNIPGTVDEAAGPDKFRTESNIACLIHVQSSIQGTVLKVRIIVGDFGCPIEEIYRHARRCRIRVCIVPCIGQIVCRGDR